MEMSQVLYNQERQIYEVMARDGQVMTCFVFPSILKAGDKLPPLYMHIWAEEGVLFKFDGEYNAGTDNLEFFIEGPVGYVYKISLQVDLPERSYAWKIKRHGHTNIGRENGATRLFVPRSLCVSPLSLLESRLEVVKRWSFSGRSVPQLFGRLRMKVAFSPARCAENPNNDHPRVSEGLYAYLNRGKGPGQEEEKEEEEVRRPLHPSAPLKGFSQYLPEGHHEAEKQEVHREEDTHPPPPPPRSAAPHATPPRTPLALELPSSRISPDVTASHKFEKQNRRCCCCLVLDADGHVHGDACGPLAALAPDDYQGSADRESAKIASSRSATSERPPDPRKAQLFYCNSIPEMTATPTSLSGMGRSDSSFSHDRGGSSESVSGVGCDNAFDIACVRADDGLKMLDDSVSLNPFESMGACLATDLSLASVAPTGTNGGGQDGSLTEDGAETGTSSGNTRTSPLPARAPSRKKVDLNTYVSIAEKFPRKLRDYLDCKLRLPTCSDGPPGFGRPQVFDDGATMKVTSGESRHPRVTKNYNQTFSFTKVDVS